MRLKFCFIALVFFSFTAAYCQQALFSANEIMKEAFKAARLENKKVFIIFHASWCGWCHKMDTAMSDPTCKKFFEDNFVIRHLVVFESKGKEKLENPGALEMLNQYHGDNQGIPYWLIFDKDEKFLADSRMQLIEKGTEKFQNTGCPATKEEVEYFIEVLKKTTSLSDEQLSVIRNRFRKNEIN